MSTWHRRNLSLVWAGALLILALLASADVAAQALSTGQVAEATCQPATPGCGAPCRAQQVNDKSLRLLLECIYQRTLDLPAWEHAGCDRSHRKWQEAAASAAWQVAHRAWIVDDDADVDRLFARAANVALSGVPASSDDSTSQVCGVAKTSIERGCQIAQCKAAAAGKLEAAARDYKAICGEGLACSALDRERCSLLAGVRAQHKLLYMVQGNATSEQQATAPITKTWREDLEGVEQRVLAAEPPDVEAIKTALRHIEDTKAAPALIAVMEQKNARVAAQLQKPEIPAARRDALVREQREASAALQEVKTLGRTNGTFKDVKERVLTLDSNLEKLRVDAVRAAK
jgi:hypothetical protein